MSYDRYGRYIEETDSSWKLQIICPCSTSQIGSALADCWRMIRWVGFRWWQSPTSFVNPSLPLRLSITTLLDSLSLASGTLAILWSISPYLQQCRSRCAPAQCVSIMSHNVHVTHRSDSVAVFRHSPQGLNYGDESLTTWLSIGTHVLVRFWAVLDLGKPPYLRTLS